MRSRHTLARFSNSLFLYEPLYVSSLFIASAMCGELYAFPTHQAPKYWKAKFSSLRSPRTVGRTGSGLPAKPPGSH